MLAISARAAPCWVRTFFLLCFRLVMIHLCCVPYSLNRVSTAGGHDHSAANPRTHGLSCLYAGKTYVGHAKTVMHGKTSPVQHAKQSIFQYISSPFMAARYHSLIVRTLPQNFELLAWTSTGDEHEIMAMKHKTLPLVGVQFHPSSFMTEHGMMLMKNFLKGRW